MSYWPTPQQAISLRESLEDLCGRITNMIQESETIDDNLRVAMHHTELEMLQCEDLAILGDPNEQILQDEMRAIYVRIYYLLHNIHGVLRNHRMQLLALDQVIHAVMMDGAASNETVERDIIYNDLHGSGR